MVTDHFKQLIKIILMLTYTALAVHSQCPRGWTYYDGDNTCIKVLETDHTWKILRLSCKDDFKLKHEADLIRIKDQSKNSFITETIVKNASRSYWIGAFYSKTQSTYVWASDNTTVKYNRFVPYPATAGSIGTCIELNQYVWRSTDCLSVNGGICEIRDADKCRVNNGDCKQICTPGILNRTCSCNKNSFLINETDCKEFSFAFLNGGEDGCLEHNGGCEEHCHYNQDDKTITCSCDEGFFIVNDTKCNDINECNDTLTMCNGTGQFCRNVVGSYTCTCKNGYSTSNKQECHDIDECMLKNGMCEHICINTQGSFICKCKEGFKKRDHHCHEEGIPDWVILMVVGAVIIICLLILALCLMRKKQREETYQIQKEEDEEGANVEVKIEGTEASSESSESEPTESSDDDDEDDDDEDDDDDNDDVDGGSKATQSIASSKGSNISKKSKGSILSKQSGKSKGSSRSKQSGRSKGSGRSKKSVRSKGSGRSKISGRSKGSDRSKHSTKSKASNQSKNPNSKIAFFKDSSETDLDVAYMSSPEFKRNRRYYTDDDSESSSQSSIDEIKSLPDLFQFNKR